MDAIYIGAILLLFALTCAFAAGCEKLGGK
jgi:hypothetical protein